MKHKIIVDIVGINNAYARFYKMYETVLETGY